MGCFQALVVGVGCVSFAKHIEIVIISNTHTHKQVEPTYTRFAHCTLGTTVVGRLSWLWPAVGVLPTDPSVGVCETFGARLVAAAAPSMSAARWLYAGASRDTCSLARRCRLVVRVHVRPFGGIRRKRRARSARGYKAAAASVAADSAAPARAVIVLAVPLYSLCGPQHRPSTLLCP
jgi:hypothetical protein